MICKTCEHEIFIISSGAAKQMNVNYYICRTCAFMQLVVLS